MAVDPIAMSPQRLAFIGDWHGNWPWTQRAINYAYENSAEIILQMGDFAYFYGHDDKYLDDLSEGLQDLGIPLMFVDGNHECFPDLYSYPILDNGLRMVRDFIYHIPRGYRWNWSGVDFMGVGGAYSVDRRWRKLNESWWLEETISDDDVAYASRPGNVDVLVSHDCPSGVTIPGLE